MSTTTSTPDQFSQLNDLLALVTHALDRLAAGDEPNQVIESTGVAAHVSQFRSRLLSAATSDKVAAGQVDDAHARDALQSQRVHAAQDMYSLAAYGWAITGSHIVYRGPFAQHDAEADAKRIGGSCVAFAIYRHPQWRETGEVVAAQCRFHGQPWSECSVEHHQMVKANPAQWPGYETRLLREVIHDPQSMSADSSDAAQDS